MRTSTKWILGGVVAACLVAAAAVAASGSGSGGASGNGGPKHRPGPFAVFRLCNDDSMTIGQCKELVKQKMQERIDQRYQQCLQDHDKSFCDEHKRMAQDRASHFGQGGNRGGSTGSGSDSGSPPG